MKHRMFYILLGIMVLLAGEMIKLFGLQILHLGSFVKHGVDLVESSVHQRQQSLVIDSGRGDFFDRAHRPLTGANYPAMAVFPLKQNSENEANRWRQLFPILGVSEVEGNRWLRPMMEPSFWPDPETGHPMQLSDHIVKSIQDLDVPGVLVTKYRERYIPPYAASHLIGFMSQDPERTKRDFSKQLIQGRMTLESRIGASGLEKTFEPYLVGVGPKLISWFVDANRNPLGGLSVRQTAPEYENYPLKVITTIDLTIQQAVEEILQKRGVDAGAVVILDAKNADVIAMASRPAYNPNRVDPSTGKWVNHALEAIVPGSIFKTVVAAAALDTNTFSANDTFTCKGELGKYGFSCWLTGGHGVLTLQEAYAKSCNIAFAQVIQRLPSSTIEDYSKRLGLLYPNGWVGRAPGQPTFRQFDQEQMGQLFSNDTNKDDEGVRVQTAIGQRDVRITPMQAANLVVTLLRGGEVLEPRVVSEMQYSTGRSFYRFRSQIRIPRHEGVSFETTSQLVRWMRDVVHDGTGKSLQTAIWPLAGKSGTAQETSSGTETMSQWFIGYGPYPQAQFAVAVVVEHTGKGQEGMATTVFKDVFDVLARR
jgi:cell division protein FtsI/penicillin-binding protein 2